MYITCILVLFFLCIFNKFYIKENFKNIKYISVIILSYNRPNNLDKLLPIINKYNLIDEIIVAHGNQDYYKKFNYSKVRNIKDYKNNSIFGGGRRFFHTSQCKNDIILFLDDDMYPSEDLLQKCYDKLLENYNTNLIIGPIGRNCEKKDMGFLIIILL